MQEVIRSRDEAIPGLGMPHWKSLKILRLGVGGITGAGGRRGSDLGDASKGCVAIGAAGG